MERDKFDNKTVTFEEHIKEEHNMWHYLCFIVLVKVKDSTEYTGPESYVAEMIKVSRARAQGRSAEGGEPRPSAEPPSWTRQWTLGLCMSSPVTFGSSRQAIHPHFKGGNRLRERSAWPSH